MRLIDLSQPVYDASPNCPSHPAVKVDVIANHAEHGWRVELLTIASHTGSHVDAPLHKLAGRASLDEIPLEKWVGRAYIADVRGIAAGSLITAEMLEATLPEKLHDHIVLIATGWGDRRAKGDEWLYESPALSPEGAQWLVDRGIRGVGIDHYSIAGSRDPVNSQTHTVLLSNDVWIVEELRFPAEVFSLKQPVKFWCLPVNFKGFTGAFCRPVIEVD